jgi:radical SAM protein with 4Fe4S-binding SPASM domain
VQTLAAELGATYTLDPTVTPHLEGDPSVLAHAVGREELVQIFRTESLVGNVEEFCAPPAPADDDVLNEVPCSAGHTLAYISPYGEVFPCVQLPLSCGNLRKRRFAEIWRESPRLLEVRAIRTRDLPACAPCSFVSTCTRCPGLAYMEGDLRGISKVDCEKSLAKVGQA